MRSALLVSLVATGVSAGITADAATYTQITDPAAISASAVTETFEGFPVPGTSLPLTSGIMTLSSGNPFGVSVVYDAGYDHPGTPGGSKWVGNSGDAEFYRFDFSAGISQFGLVMYGHQFSGTTMQLFDAADQSLASFAVAAPGGGSGQYTGFTADTGNVRSVLIDFGGVDAVWIDNVSYLEDGGSPMSPVPLPASLPLLMVAFGAVAIAGRRRRA